MPSQSEAESIVPASPMKIAAFWRPKKRELKRRKANSAPAIQASNCDTLGCVPDARTARAEKVMHPRVPESPSTPSIILKAFMTPTMPTMVSGRPAHARLTSTPGNSFPETQQADVKPLAAATQHRISRAMRNLNETSQRSSATPAAMIGRQSAIRPRPDLVCNAGKAAVASTKAA